MLTQVFLNIKTLNLSLEEPAPPLAISPPVSSLLRKQNVSRKYRSAPTLVPAPSFMLDFKIWHQLPVIVKAMLS